MPQNPMNDELRSALQNLGLHGQYENTDLNDVRAVERLRNQALKIVNERANVGDATNSAIEHERDRLVSDARKVLRATGMTRSAASEAIDVAQVHAKGSYKSPEAYAAEQREWARRQAALQADLAREAEQKKASAAAREELKTKYGIDDPRKATIDVGKRLAHGWDAPEYDLKHIAGLTDLAMGRELAPIGIVNRAALIKLYRQAASQAREALGVPEGATTEEVTEAGRRVALNMPRGRLEEATAGDRYSKLQAQVKLLGGDESEFTSVRVMEYLGAETGRRAAEILQRGTVIDAGELMIPVKAATRNEDRKKLIADLDEVGVKAHVQKIITDNPAGPKEPPQYYLVVPADATAMLQRAAEVHAAANPSTAKPAKKGGLLSSVLDLFRRGGSGPTTPGDDTPVSGLTGKPAGLPALLDAAREGPVGAAPTDYSTNIRDIPKRVSPSRVDQQGRQTSAHPEEVGKAAERTNRTNTKSKNTNRTAGGAMVGDGALDVVTGLATDDAEKVATGLANTTVGAAMIMGPEAAAGAAGKLVVPYAAAKIIIDSAEKYVQGDKRGAGEAIMTGTAGFAGGAIGYSAGSGAAVALGATEGGFLAATVGTGGAALIGASVAGGVYLANRAVDQALYGESDKSFTKKSKDGLHMKGVTDYSEDVKKVVFTADDPNGSKIWSNPDRLEWLGVSLQKELNTLKMRERITGSIIPRTIVPTEYRAQKVANQEDIAGDIRLLTTAKAEIEERVYELRQQDKVNEAAGNLYVAVLNNNLKKYGVHAEKHDGKLVVKDKEALQRIAMLSEEETRRRVADIASAREPGRQGDKRFLDTLHNEAKKVQAEAANPRQERVADTITKAVDASENERPAGERRAVLPEENKDARACKIAASIVFQEMLVEMNGGYYPAEYARKTEGIAKLLMGKSMPEKQEMVDALLHAAGVTISDNGANAGEWRKNRQSFFEQNGIIEQGALGRFRISQRDYESPDVYPNPQRKNDAEREQLAQQLLAVIQANADGPKFASGSADSSLKPKPVTYTAPPSVEAGRQPQ